MSAARGLSRPERPARAAFFDLRGIAHVLGVLTVSLAAMMLIPAALDAADGRADAGGFGDAAGYCAAVGVMIMLATRNGLGRGFSIRQAFLLTAGIWAGLPLAGALPFMLGAPHAGFTDAYFEAVSGITTTGSSVFVHLEELPRGTLLWRGILNWLGGLGIAFVAMIFLPVMKVGGMQFFKTEGFDTMGKVLPRAGDIARALLQFYLLLTAACAGAYMLFGMIPFDAIVNAFATVATGGFSTSDASFGKYAGPAEYAGTLFMILSALPYIRFVQMLRGQVRPMLRDPQSGAMLRWMAYAILAVCLYRLATSDLGPEEIFRTTAFNLVSIFTGTGFGSANVAQWGDFAMVVALVVGLIGGCTSSSSGALSVFRSIVLGRAILALIRNVHSPHRLAPIRYEGRTVEPDVLNPIIMYATGYLTTILVLSIVMTMTGVDMVSALFAVWTSIGNIGYVFGDLTARTGTMVDFPPLAKWIMIVAMLMGRLGLLSILVLAMPRFWRP